MLLTSLVLGAFTSIIVALSRVVVMAVKTRPDLIRAKTEREIKLRSLPTIVAGHSRRRRPAVPDGQDKDRPL